MNCALITGGLGFIGTHIAHQLLRGKHVEKVVLLDHYGSYIRPTSEDYVDYRYLRVKGIESDIIVERGQTNYPNVLSHIIWQYQPRYIFHLAALPLASLENMNTQEAIEGSILSTAYLLEICDNLRKDIGYQLDRFIYTSSSMVYGNFAYTPADENHPQIPTNIYGTMKLAGEEVTRGLSRVYNIKSTIIRPSAVYGPTDMNRRVTQVFIEDALAGKKLIVNGEDEKLDFTFVEDTAKGFVLAGTHEGGIGETFNITSGHAHSLVEYVQILKEHFPELQYEIRPRDGSRPIRGTLSIEKAQRLLGFSPDWTLRKGIARYVEFVKTYGKQPLHHIR